jgi:hypothetical protein
LAAFDGQRSVLVTDRTKPSAVRTRVVGCDGLNLLVQQGIEGALGQAGGGGSGDLLHGLEVDGGVGAGVGEDAAGDDFAPAGGEVTDLLEFFSREFALRHGQSCLVLAVIEGDAFLLPLYCTAL